MTPSAPLPDGAVIDAAGVWVQVLSPPPDTDRAALFLDRDGTIVEEAHYLSRAEDTRLIAGAASVIARANRLEVPVVVVSNQSGIGRGYYGWEEFLAVQEKMLGDLAAAGATVDGVFACPHHSEGRAPYQHPDHPARKPNPGMLLRAAETLRLDLAGSWIVGDHASDMGAGRNGGLGGGIHVRTGHGAHPGQREAALALNDGRFPVRAADSISEAAALIPLLAPSPGR